MPVYDPGSRCCNRRPDLHSEVVMVRGSQHFPKTTIAVDVMPLRVDSKSHATTCQLISGDTQVIVDTPGEFEDEVELWQS